MAHEVASRAKEFARLEVSLARLVFSELAQMSRSMSDSPSWRPFTFVVQGRSSASEQDV